MHELLAVAEAADQPLLDRARDIYDHQLEGQIDDIVVRELNKQLGTDLATAILYVHFESKLLATGERAFASQSDGNTNQRPLLVAIAPGAFYKEHPEIGANGRELIELSRTQTWKCEVIPAESLGTLNTNALIINDFLEHTIRSHRVLLVTLSKGTTDALTAQKMRPDQFDSLLGWISVSGVDYGTKMSDWLLDRWRLRPILQLMLWSHRVSSQAIRDLRYRPAQPTESPDCSTHFPRLHVVGFPLKRHLSCWRARLWHRRFRREGPNDGVLMLADLLRLSGIVIPVWGSDHYMQSGWNVPEAVVRLIALLEGGTPVSDSKTANHVTSQHRSVFTGIP